MIPFTAQAAKEAVGQGGARVFFNTKEEARYALNHYPGVRIAGLVPHSLVNGPGVRFTVFFQGCPHGCPGCQNPRTHNVNGGRVFPVRAIIEQINQAKLIDGVTLSGGEPLLQASACRLIAQEARLQRLNVWCYTGWRVEDLLSGAAGTEAIEALNWIDVLVDGPFREEMKPTRPEECLWRGSVNQRLINMKQTWIEHRPLEWSSERSNDELSQEN